MDEFLAELYGTRETVGADSGTSDMDKLAEAQVLDSIFEAEGINVDEVPDESILKLAYEIFGDNSALVKEAMEGEEKKEDEEEESTEEESPKKKEEGAEKEAESFEEKFAQADQLGRVMAHAFVNEQSEIEKKAVSGGQAIQALKNVGQLAGYGAKKGGKAAKRLATSPGRTFKHVRGEEGVSIPKALLETARAHKGQTAAGALGAAGVGGAAAALKKKSASALDMLAEQRAIEMLKEAGIEQEPANEEKLAATIDQRALEMLVEAGYSVE